MRWRLACVVLVSLATAEEALVRCDLGPEAAARRLGLGLALRGDRCPLFAPIGDVVTSGPVCLKALPQSGSTWLELTVSLLLETACGSVEGCAFERFASGAKETPDEAAAAWPGGERTVYSYHKKHAPIQRDCPRSLVLLRDPRFRAASHLRYHEEQRGRRRDDPGGKKRRAPRGLPEAVHEWDVNQALRGEQHQLVAHFLEAFDGNDRERRGTSALLVRYEMLADPATGPGVLADVDAYLGLPATRRGARLPRALAARVLRNTSYAALAERCGGFADLPKAVRDPNCPASRPEELWRAHAPKGLDALLVGGNASGVDAELGKHALLRGLWGCFRAPQNATVPRPRNAASCPPRPPPRTPDRDAPPRTALPGKRGWNPAPSSPLAKEEKHFLKGNFRRAVGRR